MRPAPGSSATRGWSWISAPAPARTRSASLVRSLLGLGATSDEAATSAALEAATRDGLLEADRRVFLNDLLDLPQPTALRALYDAMDHGARSRGRQDAVAELVERAGQEAPQLVIVEDIHWADGPTLGHLARLARTAGAARAVLVMTSRMEGDPLDQVWRASAGGSPLLTLDLGPLRDDEAGALAHAYVDASAELARRCVARAAGNPLFLDQLLRHAEESTEEGVPGSVQSLVQARLDHLVARRPPGAAGGIGARTALHAGCARPSAGPAGSRLRRSRAPSAGAIDRRRAPVRPRADPRWRLRLAAAQPARRAASACRGMVRGARCRPARRASRSRSRPGRARRLPGGGAQPARDLSLRRARSISPSTAWRSHGPSSRPSR